MSVRFTALVTAFIAVLVGSVVSATAQQITGTPGSPNATTTIDGRYLPPPPQKFQGEINLNALQSKEAWPARVVPPKDAPNILLIITDDVGFGAPSTFGGVIPTPALDQIASEGLRFTNFHTTALCSPTRAALITGRNHHSVGFGVISEQATGFPGYNSIIPKDSATIGRILLENGYRTSWFGKNHNTPRRLLLLLRATNVVDRQGGLLPTVWSFGQAGPAPSVHSRTSASAVRWRFG